MDCSCDYEDQPDFYKKVWRTANKQHFCCECGYKIQHKESYEYVTSGYDGSVSNYKTCERCADLRDSLSSCYVHEGLFEAYSSYVGIHQYHKVYDRHRNWRTE
jgi:hypothetical protein